MEIPDTNGYRAPFFYVVSLLCTIALGLSGWTLLKVQDNDDSIQDNSTRISVIEDTRFTKEDGERLKSDLMHEMRDGFDEVKACIRSDDGECD